MILISTYYIYILFLLYEAQIISPSFGKLWFMCFVLDSWLLQKGSIRSLGGFTAVQIHGRCQILVVHFKCSTGSTTCTPSTVYSTRISTSHIINKNDGR